MSERICVSLPEKDINFILPVQNFGNFNQTSQFCTRETHFQIQFWGSNVSSEVMKK